MIRGGERLGSEVIEGGDALADAGAVAQLEKMNLAAGTPVVEPSRERDLFAGVFRKLFDKDAFGHAPY